MTRSSEREVLSVIDAAEELAIAVIEYNEGKRDKPTGTPLYAKILRLRSALQSVEGGVQGSIATKQESCPESAPRTETTTVTALRECQRVLAMMIDPASIKSTSVIHAFTAATAAEAKARAALSGVTNSAPATKSDGGVEGNAISGTGPALEQSRQPETPSAGIKPGPSDAKLAIAVSALEFVRDGYGDQDVNHVDYRVRVYEVALDALAQLTKTPSADHDAGNLRGLAEPNHHQPHALSQGWRDDMENAPHNVPVLLAWQDWRDGQWCMEIGPAIMGQRYANGYSSISHHGSATHWQPRPAPPAPENTPRDSSESTTGGTAPDHTTMEERGR